jgi:hypothetical protein
MNERRKNTMPTNTALKLPEHVSITPADADIARPEQPTAEHSTEACQLRICEAHDLLVEQSRTQHDELIQARDIRLLTLNGLRIGTEEYPLVSTARRNLFTLMGLPAAYMLKLPLYLQQINLNYAVLKDKERRLLLRFEAGRIRAVLSESYVPIDHHEIVKGLMDAGVHKNKNVQLRVDKTLMQLNMLEKNRTFRVKADDTFIPGLCITNSETGLAGLSVSAYLQRQINNTGMIQNIWGTSTNFRHTTRYPMQRLGDTLGRAYTKTHNQKHILKHALKERIPEPERFVLKAAAKYKLSKAQQYALEDALYRSVDRSHADTRLEQNLYSSAHIFTAAAQHHSLNTLQSAMLQQIGGAVVELGLYD